MSKQANPPPIWRSRLSFAGDLGSDGASGRKHLFDVSARRGLEWWRLGPRGATCGSGVGGVGGAARSSRKIKDVSAATQVQSLLVH